MGDDSRGGKGGKIQLKRFCVCVRRRVSIDAIIAVTWQNDDVLLHLCSMSFAYGETRALTFLFTNDADMKIVLAFSQSFSSQSIEQNVYEP